VMQPLRMIAWKAEEFGLELEGSEEGQHDQGLEED
jgi:hypothetical protein